MLPDFPELTKRNDMTENPDKPNNEKWTTSELTRNPTYLTLRVNPYKYKDNPN